MIIGTVCTIKDSEFNESSLVCCHNIKIFFLVKSSPCIILTLIYQVHDFGKKISVKSKGKLTLDFL